MDKKQEIVSDNDKSCKSDNRRNLPLVSVIIPVYNHEYFVSHTLTSIARQTYSNIELIVINDGSPDNSLEVIKSYEEELRQRTSNFILIDQPNAGIVNALNAGIKASKGEYLYIIASDDIAKVTAIETLVNFYIEHDSVEEYGFVVGDSQVIDENGRGIFYKDNYAITYDIKEADYKTFGKLLEDKNTDISFDSEKFGSYESLVKGNYIPNGYLIRRKYIERVGYYNPEIKLEDWYMNLQLAKICKFKFIDEVLFEYRQHSNNTVKRKLHMKELSLAVLANEESYCKNKDLLDVWNDSFRRLKRSLAKEYRRQRFSIKLSCSSVVVRAFGKNLVSWKK